MSVGSLEEIVVAVRIDSNHWSQSSGTSRRIRFAVPILIP